MKTDKIIRVRLSSWKAIRSVFPGERGESMADYMDRLSKWLKEMEEDNNRLTMVRNSQGGLYY